MCCNKKWLRLPVTGKLHRRALVILCVSVCLDLLSCCLLFAITNGMSFPLSLARISRDFDRFANGTADCIVFALLRILTLASLGSLAIAKGVPKELWLYSSSHSDSPPKAPSSDKDTNSPKEPLLADHSEQYRVVVSNVRKRLETSTSVSLVGAEAFGDDELKEALGERSVLPSFESKAEEKDYEERKHRAVIVKNILLLLCFLLFTFYQGYVGVKCVLFHFNTHRIAYQAMCFGGIVFCINVEIFCLKMIVDAATDLGEGILIKDIHPHVLYQKKKLKYWCDLCRSKAKFYTYRCATCNFDICSRCYKKRVKKRRQELAEKKKKKKEKQSSVGNDMDKGGSFRGFDMSMAVGSQRKHVIRSDKGEKEHKVLTTKDYIFRAAALVSPFKTIIACAFLCLMINSAANLLLPNVQGKILNRIINGNRAGFYEEVKIYVILSVCTGLFGSIRNLCFRVVGRKLTVSTRSQIFRSVIVQDIAFFDGLSTGELTSRMSNDVSGMIAPVRYSLATCFSNIISLAGGLAMCFYTSWRLSMLAFTTIAPVIFLTGQYAKWSREMSRSIWAALGDGNNVATQALSNIRTVRAFGMERKEIAKFDSSMDEALQRGIIDAIAATGTFALTNYLDLGAGVLILYFGGLTIFHIENGSQKNSDLTTGKLIAFQLYWNMINNAYKGLQNVLAQFTRAAGGAQRIFTLLDSLPDIDLESGLDPGTLQGHIELRNVYFHYLTRPERPVLQGVNLEVNPGQVVALVGRSGGGKSTIINLLVRFYDCMEGSILIDGIDIRDINLSKYRKQIGIVAQDTQLFDTTIEDNICYGIDERFEKEEMYHAARLANAYEFIMEFEEGFATAVGERGVRLSGGQKQRIAIARMLMKRPRLLFLDEATSALDTESEALVQAAIDKTIWKDEKKEKREKKEEEEEPSRDSSEYQAAAVILVAHRLSTVVNADRIAVVDKGRIVEIGSHDELLEYGGVYAKLVQRQLQKEKNQLDHESMVASSATAGDASASRDDTTIDALFEEMEEKRPTPENHPSTDSTLPSS